jgi:hypothetical protein
VRRTYMMFVGDMVGVLYFVTRSISVFPRIVLVTRYEYCVNITVYLGSTLI